MDNTSTRRTFLKRSAALTAGTAIFPQIISSTALGMGGRKAPGERFVMGIIGAGGNGMGAIEKLVEFRSDVQVVAVCDVDSLHLAKAKKMIDEAYRNRDCRTYEHFREFLDREKMDAVYIAVPDHWHGIIYSEAAQKNLNVFGQKPLCRTIEDGQAIVRAVRKNNITWQTGCQQRSTENFHRGAELAINGRVGEIKYIEVGMPDSVRRIGTPRIQEVPPELNWDLWLGPALKVPYRGVCHRDWRWQLDYSGGQTTDWAGHHIDIAQWGTGMDRTGPVEISGKGYYPSEGIYNVPFEYDIQCKYANGLEMRIANASRMPLTMGITWYGEDGWVHVDRKRDVLKASDPTILKEVIGDDEIKLYKSTNHIKNFFDCIRSGEETIAPVEIGFSSIAVALLGEIAMTTGETIYWDPDEQKIIGNHRASRLLGRPYRAPWKLPSL